MVTAAWSDKRRLLTTAAAKLVAAVIRDALAERAEDGAGEPVDADAERARSPIWTEHESKRPSERTLGGGSKTVVPLHF